MRHRYTMKELQEWSDYRLLTELIIERRSDCTNVYSPLHKRLVKLQNKIERNETLTKDKPERYINLYDDEEADFYILTDCPSKEFEKLLDTYRKVAREKEGCYNYDDFFAELKRQGYKVEVVKSTERYYF